MRLEVNPAPTSRTEPEAILTKTRFHSEKITINLRVKKSRTEPMAILLNTRKKINVTCEADLGFLPLSVLEIFQANLFG